MLRCTSYLNNGIASSLRTRGDRLQLIIVAPPPLITFKGAHVGTLGNNSELFRHSRDDYQRDVTLFLFSNRPCENKEKSWYLQWTRSDK
jgi:hypothetical protein